MARLAGVSQALVSNVLNTTDLRVTAATRRRILHAAETLGYVPHGAARSLRTRRTMTIALVVPDIRNPYWPEVQRGVEEVAERAGYQVMMFNTDNDPARLTSACRTIISVGADGAIICDLRGSSREIAQLTATGTPVVHIGDGRVLDDHVDRITLDNTAAAREVGRWFGERGFSRVATIAGSRHTTNGADRLHGFLEGLREGSGGRTTAEVAYGDFTFESGREAMEELIARHDRPPDAVFAANDLMALGAMQALLTAGHDIPGDTALVGFDDIAVARMVAPSLTTVDHPKRALGQRAAELLVSRMTTDPDAPARTEVMPYELVRRASA